MEGASFTLILPSDLRMLSVARGFVEAVCEAHQIERNYLNALAIVIGEAISNIVRHAHRNCPHAQMEIHFQIFPDRLVLSFQDQGEPFDFTAVPQLPPGELRVGGRGVYLMRTLMDELTYTPRSEGQPGNVLRMVKYCPAGKNLRECG